VGLKNHVALHDHLAGTRTYSPVLKKQTVKSILSGVQASLAGRANEEKKQILLPDPMPAISFQTDPVLVTRILRDMVVNALEAGAPGSKIKLSVKRGTDRLTFSVWNKGAMSKDVLQRIFQRNFSTKTGAGRGLGTYSMKVFGEQLLGGRVSFTSTSSAGTRFNLALPLKASKKAKTVKKA
jgi:signal transduction histidine kinase